MKASKIILVLLLCLSFVRAAGAQFVSVGGGVLRPQSLSSPPPPGAVGSAARADFSNSSIVTVDAGIGFLSLLGAAVHYSFSRPELLVRRGDAFGSSARVDLDAHTLTFDARLHSPSAGGFRVYGFAGAGFTRFTITLKNQVEVPFPRGVPSNITAPVADFGGGIEKKFAPLVAGKFEVRDYVTPISSTFFSPGGAWHRVAVTGGIVLGR